ncbi:MAG: hypothetical protein AB7N80_08000 [Bdellovibrionales bacterium]
MSFNKLFFILVLGLTSNFALAGQENAQCIQNVASSLGLQANAKKIVAGVADFEGGAIRDCELIIEHFVETREGVPTGVERLSFSMEAFSVQPGTKIRRVYTGANSSLINIDSLLSSQNVVTCEAGAENLKLRFQDTQKFGREKTFDNLVKLTRDAQGKIVSAAMTSEGPFSAGTVFCRFSPEGNK